MVEEDVCEGPGVPHAPHGRGRNVQVASDLLLCRRQESVLVRVEGEVSCRQGNCRYLDCQYRGMLFVKLTGKTRKEVDEFGNLEEHLDIEPLEMVDSRDNWSEPSNIALKSEIIFLNFITHISIIVKPQYMHVCQVQRKTISPNGTWADIKILGLS